MNSFPRPIIVGHRGFPHLYPENSLIGVLEAIKLGVKAVELDIQISRDGCAWMLHDPTFLRTSEAQGNILELDSSTIKRVSVHEPARFSQSFFPTPIITLADLCKEIASFDIEVFIEIKQDSYRYHSIEKIAEIVISASACLYGKVEGSGKKKRKIISYDANILEYIKREYGEEVGFILKEYNLTAKQTLLELNPDYAICNYKKIGAREKLWNIHCPWFLYDITDMEIADYWAAAGVEYIESWNPIELLNV